MSKVTELNCPKCGASLEPTPGQHTVVCKYCGDVFDYDDGSQTININHSYSDEAEIAKVSLATSLIHLLIALISAYRKQIAIILLVLGAFILVGTVITNTRDQQFEAQGLVSAGVSSRSFIGKNYKTVVQRLKDRGFKKIKKIAVGGGLAVWDWGKVTEVTINGVSFGAHDYFDPKVPVVVSYK